MNIRALVTVLIGLTVLTSCKDDNSDGMKDTLASIDKRLAETNSKIDDIKGALNALPKTSPGVLFPEVICRAKNNSDADFEGCAKNICMKVGYKNFVYGDTARLSNADNQVDRLKLVSLICD